jgi:signal transduction histidine kinase
MDKPAEKAKNDPVWMRLTLFTPRGILPISNTAASKFSAFASQSLAANLLRVVLAIYLSLAILLTLGQLTLEYQNEKRRLNTEIENVASTFKPIIAKALWNVDDEQIRTSLQGVLGINYDVLHVQLLDVDGRLLNEFDSPANKDTAPNTWPVIGHLAHWFLEDYTYDYPLFYQSDFIHPREIGRLVLHSNSNVVLARAAHTFLITIVSAMFKTALLVLIFYYIMRRMVGRPLKQITRAMQKLDPRNRDTDEQAACAPQLFSRHDELGVMVRTFQEMSESLKQKDMAIHAHASHLEAKVQERTRQLEEASQAKSDFLAAVSHEIRTPMNGILGLAHLLGETELTPQQRQYVEVIEKSGKSLINIINEILDHLKIESKKIELESTLFNLEDLFRDSITLFSHRAREAAIQVEMHYAPECPTWCIGDPTRTRQVLLNLLGNAFKFTSSGTIRVTAQAQTQAARQVRVLMAVEDSGIGIDENQLQRLFKPFSQADSSTTRRYGGTGLGLAISKQLVELMGGTIGVESRPGSGSRFWFSLPLEIAPAPTNMPAAGAADDHGQSVNLATLKVLVAEDNPVNQLVITGYLKKYAIEPQVVTDGLQAVEFCAANAHALDLILMDGEMPEMDGWQAAARIRELNARRPNGEAVVIVAMTAHAPDTHEETAARHGMNDFLQKPIDPKELRRILLSVSGHGD